MSGLFSSPGKSAQQGASGLQGIDQGIINQLENYVGQQQQAERGAIAGVAQNPYFNAAQTMNPDAYFVNPGQTQTFGTTAGPGTHSGASGSISAGAPPPPWKPPEPKQAGGDGGGPKMKPPIIQPPPGGWGGGPGRWGGGVGHEPQ